jgi:hypothetical protein
MSKVALSGNVLGTGTNAITSKRCNKCHVYKPLSDYHKRPERPIGVRSMCKICLNAKRQIKYEIYKSNGMLNEYIWRRTGINITYSEYLLKYEMAGGCCEICHKHFDKLCVDHNHQTEQVRGLLCVPCNLAIEHLKESPEIMNNAIKYIQKYGGRNV